MECIICGGEMNTSPDPVRCYGCASGYRSLKPTSRPVMPSDCTPTVDLRKLYERLDSAAGSRQTDWEQGVA